MIIQNFGKGTEIGQEMRALFSKLLRTEGSVGEAFKRWNKEILADVDTRTKKAERFISQAVLVNIVHIVIGSRIEEIPPNMLIKKLGVLEDFQWVFLEKEILTFNARFIPEIKPCKLDPRDLFGEVHHDFLQATDRHEKGSFYTNRILAKKMVEDSYQPNSTTLDPACGSGMFLCALYSKILAQARSRDEYFPEQKLREALQKVAGFDLDPLAVMMARANLILIAHENGLCDYEPRVYLHNSLDDRLPDEIRGRFDLVIGNPPWIVLNRIRSSKQKSRIKTLGNRYGVLLGGKLASTTEITTVFIYKNLRDMLTPGGTLFFVAPASLVTGSQHALFRQFTGMGNLEVWAFESDAFPIHNICLKAQKVTSRLSQIYPIPYRTFRYSETTQYLEELPRTQAIPIEIVQMSTDTSEISLDDMGETNKPAAEFHIGRLALSEDFPDDETEIKAHLNTLIKKKTEYSNYRAQFRQGASLVPRNLLFISKPGNPGDGDGEPHEGRVQIRPASNIRSKKYSTWDFTLDYSTLVEPEYLFRIAKSTGLVPFLYRSEDYAFLPVESIGDSEYRVGTPSKPGAMAHCTWLEEVYQEHMKPGAKIRSLAARINYGKALTNPRQFQELKVIYGGIGSMVKSAIVTGNYIVDTSLYFFIPQSLEEAYFLIGFLNSGYVTRHVKKVGSTGAGGSLRNIHKHPFDLSLPIFNPNNRQHMELAIFSNRLEHMVLEFVERTVRTNPDIRNKNKAIQNRLLKDNEYCNEMQRLSEMVRTLVINPV